MIELGKEMVEWVKINDPLHLSEWYTIEKMFTYNEWKTFLQCKEFLPYYEQALKVVGRKYLDKNSNVRDGISQRWQRVYFKDLKELEDEDIILKAEATEKAKAKYNTQENAVGLLAQINQSIQSQKLDVNSSSESKAKDSSKSE